MPIMENLLEAIRIAIEPDASDDARAAGVAACRTIVTALEARSGEPMVRPLPEPAQIAAMIRSLRGVPTEQLLDLAIAKARSMLPPGTEIQPVTSFKFTRVPVPRPG